MTARAIFPLTLFFSLVFLLLSGCINNSWNEEISSQDTPNDAVSFYNATLAKNGITRFTLLTTERANLTFTFDNGRPDSVGKLVEACGFWNVTIPMQALNWGKKAWSESRGHALGVKSEYANQSVPADASETLFLATSFHLLNETIMASKGDRIEIVLAQDNGRGVPYLPFVSVRADKAVLREVSRQDVAFTCGTNLDQFQGRIAYSGETPAALVVARDARAVFNPLNGTQAIFTIALYPNPLGGGGHCKTAIEANGKPAVQTENQTMGAPSVALCHLRYKGPPGAIAFAIPELEANGPLIRYWLVDSADSWLLP